MMWKSILFLFLLVLSALTSIYSQNVGDPPRIKPRPDTAPDAAVRKPPSHNIEESHDQVPKAPNKFDEIKTKRPVEHNRQQAAPQDDRKHLKQQMENHMSQLATCKEDISNYCRDVDKASDIAVLECLQNAGINEETTLTSKCEQTVWEFKVNLTQDDRFKHAIDIYCKDEMAKSIDLAECKNEAKKGYALSCVLEFKDNMTESSKCHSFLTRVERLAFSDFRLVGPFVEKCGKFVKQFECGSLEPYNEDERSHSQGQTLECLIEKLVEKHKGSDKAAQDAIDNDCRHEIMRIAELQADDYHLDRPLFFACRTDRDKLCSSIQAGEGRVFQCLLQHTDETSVQCRKILMERAELLGRDAKISHPLMEACEHDLQKHQCSPQGLSDAHESYQLSFVLLCLENAQHSSDQLTAECAEQMVKHRTLMMTDYRISPEVVMSCGQDIDIHCGGQLEGGGKTLHCLMGVAAQGARLKEKQQLSAPCMASLRTLVKVADPGSNYKVDRVLQKSCHELIQGQCRQEATSEASILSCMMRHLEDDSMSDSCEDRLLEIQYFMARDWQLDPGLYKACHKDATEQCHAEKDWYHQKKEVEGPDTSGVVLACLYRHAYSEDPGTAKLNKKCTHEVRRVLHERAARVNLLPNIEDACRMALSVFCSHEGIEVEEEMNCLQEHMDTIKGDTKYGKCYVELEQFTKMQSQDVKLNRVLSRACRPIIGRYCQHLMDEDIDHGDVMECLLAHKTENEMTDKCMAYVKHYELISMANYEFSYKFKKSCAKDIATHCRDEGNDKTAIIRCLSEIVFKHRVLGEGTDIDKSCKKQLSTEYLAGEKADAHANKPLFMKCKNDIAKHHCYNEGDTVEDVTECLRQQTQLEPSCKAIIFKREEIEFADSKLDTKLIEVCKEEIESLCGNDDQIFKCLKRHRKDVKMGHQCLSIIKERMHQQASDIRLQPNVLMACKESLKEYCKREYDQIQQPKYEQKMLEGAAVACLREVLVTKRHEHKAIKNENCVREIHRIILESELDPQLDLPFYRVCKEEIETHCSSEILRGPSHEDIIECIKATYHEHRITSKKCKKEIGRRVSEELSDIHLDPTLHEACALDLKHYCNDVPPGDGRLISCLLSALESSNTKISKKCRSRLEDRKKLWDVAHKDEGVELPSDVAEFASLVLDSPIRNRLMTIFIIAILLIFCWGLCCGRVTKRIRRDIKNK